MLKKLLDFAGRCREIILYSIFGVLTTAVNYAVYIAWVRAFPGNYANMAGTSAAWVIAVLFAYFTNRKWVFSSRAEGFAARLRECSAFFASRVLSGLADLGVMYAAVDVMRFNGDIVKLLSNIAVIVMNYILSKFFIFRGSGGGDRDSRKGA